MGLLATWGESSYVYNAVHVVESEDVKKKSQRGKQSQLRTSPWRLHSLNTTINSAPALRERPIGALGTRDHTTTRANIRNRKEKNKRLCTLQFLLKRPFTLRPLKFAGIRDINPHLFGWTAYTASAGAQEQKAEANKP